MEYYIVKKPKGDSLNLWGKEIVGIFEDLRESKRFNEIVSAIRGKIGIPKNGYKVDKIRNKQGLFLPEGYLDKKQSKLLLLKEKKLFKAMGLQSYLKTIVHDYILKGSDFGKGFVIVNPSGYGCEWVPTKYGANLKIYSGTSKEDIIESVRKNWGKIEKHLKIFHPNNHTKRYRDKVKKLRDKKIMELFEKNILHRNGKINVKNAKTFALIKGESNYRKSVEREFEKNGFALPKRHATKKVIDNIISMRRK